MQIQQHIVQQVESILKLNAGTIQQHDNLIEYGLHSLSIMQLVDSFEKKFSQPLAYADFAMAPTIQEWVELIEQGGAATSQSMALDQPQIQLPVAEQPLSEMQYAYWAGGQTEGVAPHLYMEFSGKGLDLEQLQSAFKRLIQRHPMLSVTIDQGMQSIQAWVDRTIQIEDLRQCSASEAEARLLEKRQQKSHQQLDLSNGQVFDLSVTLLADQSHIVHLDADMTAIDPQSFMIMAEDLAALYAGQTLSPLASSSVEYFDYLERRQQDSDYQQQLLNDRAWWQSRLSNIAPAPQLPTIAEELRQDEHQFERFIHLFNAEQNQQLQSLAEKYAVSVESLCLALFSAVISNWSADSRFRLNLPFFIREPYVENVSQLVGDFTHLSLLNVHLNAQDDLLTTTKRLQDEVAQVANHYRYAGIHVLRDLSKLNQQLEVSPIVFTSTLKVGEIFSENLQQVLGKPIWCISQGPKVNLDVQIAYYEQGLVINWDVRINAFRPKVIERMFDAYIHSIEQLILNGDLQLSASMSNCIADPSSVEIHPMIGQCLSVDHLTQLKRKPSQIQYQVLNTLGNQCPPWVMGKLWLKEDEQIGIEAEAWYETEYWAIQDENAQLKIHSDPTALIPSLEGWMDAAELSRSIAQISGITHAELYHLKLAEKSQLIACLSLDSDQSFTGDEIQFAYAAYLPPHLSPELSYIVSTDSSIAPRLNHQDLIEFIASHQAIEQIQDQESITISPVQRVVSMLMAHLIGIPTLAESADLDFFDEGGDSLMATHLVSSINVYFKQAGISVVDIFTHRTADQVARLLEQKLAEQAEQIAHVFLSVIEGKADR